MTQIGVRLLPIDRLAPTKWNISRIEVGHQTSAMGTKQFGNMGSRDRSHYVIISLEGI